MLDLTGFTQSKAPAKRLQVDDWIVVGGSLFRIITIRTFKGADCRELGLIDLPNVNSIYHNRTASLMLSDDFSVEFYNQK